MAEYWDSYHSYLPGYTSCYYHPYDYVHPTPTHTPPDSPHAPPEYLHALPDYLHQHWSCYYHPYDYVHPTPTHTPPYPDTPPDSPHAPPEYLHALPDYLHQHWRVIERYPTLVTSQPRTLAECTLFLEKDNSFLTPWNWNDGEPSEEPHDEPKPKEYMTFVYGTSFFVHQPIPVEAEEIGSPLNTAIPNSNTDFEELREMTPFTIDEDDEAYDIRTIKKWLDAMEKINNDVPLKTTTSSSSEDSKESKGATTSRRDEDSLDLIRINQWLDELVKINTEAREVIEHK